MSWLASILITASVYGLNPPPPALIIFGGSGGATQLSIESNVRTLAEALKLRHPWILFTAGNAQVRSVQVASKERDETTEILGLVFDRRDNLAVTFRSPQTRFDDADTKNSLFRALDRSKGDAGGTIVFGVGHGSPKMNGQPASVELWNDSLSVEELAHYLDDHRRTSVMAWVLGACHSGAFVDIAWTDAMTTKGKIAQPVRCVFAAVPRDRLAAGCTADADDPSARAYMGAISEAFTPSSHADYDHDGHVSLREAHAYANLHDNTVDLPTSTLDQWMKAVLGKRAIAGEATMLKHILDIASPEQRAVIVGMNPFPERKDAPKAAAEKLASIHRRGKKVQSQIDAAEHEYEKLRQSLLTEIYDQYPELENPYHSESRRLLAGEAREFMEWLRLKPALRMLASRDDEIAELEAQRFELDKQASWIERFLSALEQVANLEAVQKSSNAKDIETLSEFLACSDLFPL